MKLKLKTRFSQRDQRWASRSLGFNAPGSEYTIGNYGCLITSLCNYINATTGRAITPDQINERLKEIKAFTFGTGLYHWDQLHKLFDGALLHYISPRFENPLTNPDLQKLRDFIDKGYMPILEIDFDPLKEGQQMHFVLLHGYEGEEFFIHDPWTGEETLLSIYGDEKISVYSYKIYALKGEKAKQGGLLANKKIDFDDAEGNRHEVGWYVYEWDIEKTRTRELEEMVKSVKEERDYWESQADYYEVQYAGEKAVREQYYERIEGLEEKYIPELQKEIIELKDKVSKLKSKQYTVYEAIVFFLKALSPRKGKNGRSEE